MMRVIFVYQYLTVGGVERVLCTRLEELADLGVEGHAWFLADGPGRSLFGHVEDRLHVGSADDCARELEIRPFDAVTVIDTEEMFPALMRVPRCPPILVEVHTPNRENRVYLNWLRRVPLKGLLAPSHYQAGLVMNILREEIPVYVVPNPLQSVFTQSIAKFRGAPPVPVVAWVGRLDRLKNWRGFVDVAAHVLANHHAPVEFWLVGHGQVRTGPDELFRHARRRKVLPHLRWFRDLAPNLMPRLYDAIRDSGGVVVSTSRHESFGLSVAEAMARGCPVVVPNSGPFPEFIEDGAEGCLYKPGSSKDAAEKIHWLLDDPRARERMGAQARRRVLEAFSPQAALPALLSALEAAAGPQIGSEEKAR